MSQKVIFAEKKALKAVINSFEKKTMVRGVCIKERFESIYH